jgi:hypothetical protein
MINRRALLEDEMFHLRRVAIHEAGHATAAAHFGVTGAIRLLPIKEGATSQGFTFVGSFSPSRGEFPDLHARCLWALSGICAEAIDGHWATVAPTLMRSLIGEADAKIAGDFEAREVIETVGLLSWLWPEVEVRATAAMEPWLNGPMVPARVIDDAEKRPATSPNQPASERRARASTRRTSRLHTMSQKAVELLRDVVRKTTREGKFQ